MIEIHIGNPTQSDFRDRGEEAHTEEQLCQLAEILMKAEEIKANEALYRAVQAHMHRKEKKFRSIADLRRHAGEKKSDDMSKRDYGNQKESAYGDD